MLICLLESELKTHYREKEFSGEQIETIIEREKTSNRFQNDAEDLLIDLEKDYFNDSINNIFDELRKDNNQVKQILLEKGGSINEIRAIFESDFRLLKSAYQSNNVSNASIQLEYLEIELDTLEKQKEEIFKIAERKASYISWIYLLFNIAALIIWIILIYFVFDWNFIEPLTWIFGIVLAVIVNAVYAIFGRTITPENMKERKFENIKSRLYGIHCFNENKCVMIEKEIELKKRFLRENSTSNN